VTHPLAELLHTSLRLLGQGWRDQDDADAARATTRCCGWRCRRGVAGSPLRSPARDEGAPARRTPAEPEGLASQPTLSRLVRTARATRGTGRCSARAFSRRPRSACGRAAAVAGQRDGLYARRWRCVRRRLCAPDGCPPLDDLVCQGPRTRASGRVVGVDRLVFRAHTPSAVAKGQAAGRQRQHREYDGLNGRNCITGQT
jgi:hypothetical protein